MTKPNWHSRIVAQSEVNPEDLLANPKNTRIHPQAQQDVLTDVLDEVGWVDSVIVNQRTGFVLDGHLRVSLALRRGEKIIPVSWVDLSEEEENLVLATLDPISAMALASAEKLSALTSTLSPQSKNLAKMIERMRETAQSSITEQAAAGSDDPTVSTPLLASAIRGEKRAGFPSGIVQILTTSLKPSTYAPAAMTEKEQKSLQRSLDTIGMRFPLLVRPLGHGQYEIVDGNQRWKAAVALGWETCPCHVQDMTREEAQLVALSVNRITGRMINDKVAAILTNVGGQFSESEIAAATGLDKSLMEAVKSASGYGTVSDENGVSVRDYKNLQESDLQTIGAHQTLVVPLSDEQYQVVASALDEVSTDWAEALVKIVTEWHRGR